VPQLEQLGMFPRNNVPQLEQLGSYRLEGDLAWLAPVTSETTPTGAIPDGTLDPGQSAEQPRRPYRATTIRMPRGCTT
jgi:hypothetical protein